METIKVGIREFRSHLPHYLLEVGQPVAITRRGKTVGYYIPSRDNDDERDVDTLKAVASKLDALLRNAGIESSDLVDEFVSLRQASNR